MVASIQIQPFAPVGVLLSKSGDDWIIEAGAEMILLGNGGKLHHARDRYAP